MCFKDVLFAFLKRSLTPESLILHSLMDNVIKIFKDRLKRWLHRRKCLLNRLGGLRLVPGTRVKMQSCDLTVTCAHVCTHTHTTTTTTNKNILEDI